MALVHQRERLRIERSVLPDRVEPVRTIAALARGQSGLVWNLLGLIVIGLIGDAVVPQAIRSLEHGLGVGPWHLGRPSSSTLQAVLAASAGATGTILGLVLSITLIVFQTTAERYGSVRIVSFLLREKGASAIVRLLALGFAYSLWTLFLLEVIRPGQLPYLSAAGALGLSTVGVLALISYRTRALLGYLPPSIAQALVTEMVGQVDRAARAGSGPSVERHAQRICDEDLQTFGDLLRKLIQEQDAHSVAAVVSSLSRYLSYYLRTKKAIRTDSLWWERESTRIAVPWMTIGESLASEGLMDLTTAQPNRSWLEGRILDHVSLVLASGLLTEGGVREAATEALQHNVQVAYYAQEFDAFFKILDSLKSLADRPEAGQYTELAERLAQTPWMTFELVANGPGFNPSRVVDAEPWRRDADSLHLFHVERKAAIELGLFIRRELGIAGTILTPRDRMIDQVRTRFAPELGALRERLVAEGYAWMHDRLKESVDNRRPVSGLLAKHALRSVLRAVHNGIEVRLPSDWSQLLLRAYAASDDSLRGDLRNDAGRLARRLAEIENWPTCWIALQAAMALSVTAQTQAVLDSDQTAIAIDRFMTLASVHAWAELHSESEHVERLARYLDAPFQNLDALAELVGDSGFPLYVLRSPGSMRYHQWFQSLSSEADSLPDRFERHGGIGFDVGKEHPSSLFAESHMGVNADDCFEHLVRACIELRDRNRRRLAELILASRTST